jgi:hypothetical protein
MVETPTGKPPVTWNALQAAGGDMSLLAPRPDTAVVHTKEEMRAKLARSH